MARSRYAYLVATRRIFPVAVFTVKHEMVSFMRENEMTEATYKVLRFSDDGRSYLTYSDRDVREMLA